MTDALRSAMRVRRPDRCLHRDVVVGKSVDLGLRIIPADPVDGLTELRRTLVT